MCLPLLVLEFQCSDAVQTLFLCLLPISNLVFLYLVIAILLRIFSCTIVLLIGFLWLAILCKNAQIVLNLHWIRFNHIACYFYIFIFYIWTMLPCVLFDHINFIEVGIKWTGGYRLKLMGKDVEKIGCKVSLRMRIFMYYSINVLGEQFNIKHVFVFFFLYVYSYNNYFSY